MLVVFPIGLLGTSVVFDLIHIFGQGEFSARLSYGLIAAGLIAGAAAAPWGAIDWLAIPENTRAKRIGAFHGAGNALVLLLFLCSGLVRYRQPDMPPGARVRPVVRRCRVDAGDGLARRRTGRSTRRGCVAQRQSQRKKLTRRSGRARSRARPGARAMTVARVARRTCIVGEASTSGHRTPRRSSPLQHSCAR